MEYLNLGNNKITDMKQVKGMPNLRRLVLSHNKLKLFEGLADLGNLRELDVSNNQIDNVGEEFPALENLEMLDISENKIPTYEILKTFEALVKLRNLSVHGNPCLMTVDEFKEPCVKINCYFDVMCLLKNIEVLDGQKLSLESWKQAYAYKEKMWWTAHNAKVEADRLAREEAKRKELEEAEKQDE